MRFTLSLADEIMDRAREVGDRNDCPSSDVIQLALQIGLICIDADWEGKLTRVDGEDLRLLLPMLDRSKL